MSEYCIFEGWGECPNKKPKQTNAERIRSLSNEELAKFLPCPYDTAGNNIMPYMLNEEMQGEPTEEYCQNCMMQWLEKEVET